MKLFKVTKIINDTFSVEIKVAKDIVDLNNEILIEDGDVTTVRIEEISSIDNYDILVKDSFPCNLVASKELMLIASTYVINNEVIKHRGGCKDDLSLIEIINKVNNYDDIVIQTDNRIDIYFQDERKRHLMQIINGDRRLKSLLGNRTIIIH